MPPRKRRRTCAPRRAAAAPGSSSSPNPKLPANLLAEIAARTDAATVFRFAAACKELRREILMPDFIHRVTQQAGPAGDALVPSKFLGLLGGSETSFSVVHPTTVASLSFAWHHMAPFVSRSAAGLLEEYGLMASRGGLVVLGRREINTRRWSQRRSDVCVYDPMSGTRAFFPAPPDVGKSPYSRFLGGGSIAVIDYAVLLTAAADGIIAGSSFMLLAADLDTSLDMSVRIRVQTLSSPDGKWGPLKSVELEPRCPWWCMRFDSYRDDAVVLGGVVHWLMHAGASFVVDVGEYILTYDVSTGTPGSVDLPAEHGNLRGTRSQCQLVSSPDGKLSLVVTDKLVVSIWVLSEGGGSWARHAVVDMEAPWWLPAWDEDEPPELLKLVRFGDQRSGAVFLRFDGIQDELLYGIDMETKAEFFTTFHENEKTGIPYEVDLASRLSSMKAF
ncbi:unnamed protein product [Urochloa humidicola]